MLYCPNKSHKQWKAMVSELGEPLSYVYFNAKGGDFLSTEEISEAKKNNLMLQDNVTNYSLKLPKLIVDKFNSFEKLWKQFKNKNDFFNKLQDNKYGLPKEQVLLLEALYTGQSFNELILDFINTYSYTVEINTSKKSYNYETDPEYDSYGNIIKENSPTQYYSNLTVPGGTNYTEQEIATPAITPSIKGHAQFATDNGIGWFRSDDKIKKWEEDSVQQLYDIYKEEFGIEYDNIKETLPKETTKKDYVFDKILGLPVYKAKFPDLVKTKTRRILELQSDLFQKGRDKELLTGQYIGDYDITPLQYNNGLWVLDGNTKEDLRIIDVWNNNVEKYTLENAPNELKTYFINKIDNNLISTKSAKNQFLQLLNKDNNWVTFFVKSIIQDSAKKGYEKVLFPTGNTASKVEGHSTLEEFKKQKEDRLNKIKKEKNKLNEYLNKSDDYIVKELNWSRKGILGNLEEIDTEINQLKQELERVETEGFAALAPIYNFYENVLANILKKNYSVKQITDEYGNTWNEISINELKDSTILLDKVETNNSEKNNNIRNDYFNGKDYNNVKDILDKISKSNHPLAQLAERLKSQIVFDINVSLTPVSFIEMGDIKAAGLFHGGRNSIEIAEFASFRHSFESTMLHEIMHAVTYYGVRNDSTTAIVFERLYKHALSNLNQKDFYALTNIDEFIVGLFTDSSFIRALENVPPVSKIKSYKNLMEEIFDRILSILKIKSKDSFYEQAFNVATNIIEEQRQMDIDEQNYAQSLIVADKSLAKDLGLHSKTLSNQQTIIVKKKVEAYNKKHGTSYFVKFSQLGQSTLYTWEIIDKANGQLNMVFDQTKQDFIKENDDFSNLNVFNFAEVNLEEAKKIITNSFINATEEEAKLIYRKFAVQYHPDKGGSEELMKHLNDVNDKFKNGKLEKEKQDINKEAIKRFYEKVKNNLEKHREGETILGKNYNNNTFKYKNDIKLTSQDFVGGILSNKGYFKVGNFIRYALQNAHLFEEDSLNILKNLTKGQYYNSPESIANTSIYAGNPSEFSSINSLGAIFVKKSSTRGYADISEIHINPAYFDINFFKNNFNNNIFKEFVNTIGHELIHKLTIPDLLSDNNTRKEIEEIYKTAKESYKNYNGIKNNITDYALSNLSEFTANYFNSKEFKDFLKTVTVKSENNKKQSLLNKLITIIARFFNKNYNITEKNAYDYLTKIINNNTFYVVPNKVFVKKANYSNVNESIRNENSNIETEINQTKQESEHFTDNEIMDSLKEFCERHGIKVEIISDLKLKGYDVVALADILTKIISLSDKANINDFTEEVAHFAVELLGDDNSYVKALMELIVSHPIYQEIKERYKNIYTSEEQFKKEAIGQLLRDAVLNKFKNEKEPSIVKQLRGLYNNFLRVINKITNNAFYKSEIDSINKKIANDIIANKIKSRQLTKDIKLASFIESEVQFFDNLLNTLKNRKNTLERKQVETGEFNLTQNVLNNITYIEEAKKKKNVEAAANMFISQINQDLIGFLTDRIDGEPSLVNTWLSNRSNFNITSQKLQEIYLFTNNYIKALEDIIDYINRYHSNNAISVYDNIIGGLNEKLKEVKELQSYYQQWERIVLRNILDEYNEGHETPYDTKQLMEELYNTASAKDSSWWRTFIGSTRKSSNNVIRLIAAKLSKYIDTVNVHRNNIADELLPLYKTFRSKYQDSDIMEIVQMDNLNNIPFLASEYKQGELDTIEKLYKINAMIEISPEAKAVSENPEFKNYQLSGKLVTLFNVLSNDEKKLYYEKRNQFIRDNFYLGDGTEIPDAYFESYRNFAENVPSEILVLKPKEKWKNNDFITKYQDPTFKQFYDYVLQLRKDDLNRIPAKFRSERNLYLLPQISSNFLDVWKNKAGMKDYLASKVKILPEDVSLYGLDVNVDYFGNEIKQVPVNFLTPINNASQDLFFLLLSFTEMSKNYEVMNKASSDMELVKNAWSHNKRYVTKNKPFSGVESNDFKILTNLINKVIYGINEDKILIDYKDKDGKEQQKDISKVIRGLAKYTSLNNLGWNIFSALSNNIKANIDVVLETTISKTLGIKYYQKAFSEFMTNGPQILMEAKSINAKNKLHKILMFNDVINIKEHYRNVNTNRTANLFFDGDFMMLPYEVAEYQSKAITALSVMYSYKIHEGKLITKKNIGSLNLTKEQFDELPSYYDNMEIVDGKVTMKIPLSDNDVFKVKDKIEYLTNLVDGKMTPLERGKAFNNAVASLVLQHRSWLAVGIDKRFSKQIYNYATQEEEIGYYRAMGNMLGIMIRDRSTILNFKIAVWDKLSEEEKIGVQRTMADLIVLTALLTIWAMLQALADDDDDWTLDSIAYLSSRVLLEHSSFMSPTEITALIKTPFAAADTLDKIQDLLLGVFHNRDVDRGAYKGYTLMEKNLIKLVPMLRQIVEMKDPKSKDKYIKANALQLFTPFDPTK